jgi:hypothetical protein
MGIDRAFLSSQKLASQYKEVAWALATVFSSAVCFSEY